MLLKDESKSIQNSNLNRSCFFFSFIKHRSFLFNSESCIDDCINFLQERNLQINIEKMSLKLGFKESSFIQ